MPANHWTRLRPATVTATLVFLVFAAVAIPALRAVASGDAADRVKYYEVAASYAGQPETLSGIALRFLGTSERWTDIFDLNVGRTQPDGGVLTDANSISVGWLLVLPWDAVGDGVHYGELPTTSSKPVSSPAPVTSPAPVAPPAPAASPAPVASPAPAAVPSGSPSPAGSGPCASAQGSSTGASAWAQERLAPQQAWSRGRGDGVTVAVVDSGVDASVPQLAGRVAAGADVVTGSGKGNTDCLGSGTAMAGLIAATDDGAAVGIAPGATILPVRVVTDEPSADVADQASAIDVAVSAGASVIALGSFVDVSQPQVTRAIENAASHDVVVVVSASAAGTTTLPYQAIRVGAMGPDGQLAEAYAPGRVDVIAPGVDVTSLGMSGTGRFRVSGTQYAVALVAGEAALLRGLDNMTAAAVVWQITRSASPLGAGPAPDPAYGWGLIDPARAMVLSAPTGPTNASPTNDSLLPTNALAAAIIVALGLVGLLLFRMRRAFGSGHTAELDLGTPTTADPTVSLGRRFQESEDTAVLGRVPASWHQADSGPRS